MYRNLEIGTLKFFDPKTQWGPVRVEGYGDVGLKGANGFTVYDIPTSFQPVFWEKFPQGAELNLKRNEEIIFTRDYSSYGKPIAYEWSRLSDWRKAEREIKNRRYKVTRKVTEGSRELPPQVMWAGANLRDLFKKFPRVTEPGGSAFKRNPLIPLWHDPVNHHIITHIWEVFWHGEWKIIDDPRAEFADFEQARLSRERIAQEGVLARV